MDPYHEHKNFSHSLRLYKLFFWGEGVYYEFRLHKSIYSQHCCCYVHTIYMTSLVPKPNKSAIVYTLFLQMR